MELLLLTTLACNVTVHHVEESRPVVGRIVASSRASAQFLAPCYGLPPDRPVTVLWVPRELWSQHSSLPFGFPFNSDGREVLPAADINRPRALTELVDLLSLNATPMAELARFARLLGLPEASSPRRVESHLRFSKRFYLDFLIDFILPHEIAHAFNNAANTARKPNWLHEWQAQIAAILVLRHRGMRRQEDVFTSYYRMMYQHGRDKVAHRTLPGCIAAGYTAMGIVNYAYFHGLLVEMYCELEEMYGRDYGERLLAVLLKQTKDRPEITDAEVVKLCSEAAGADLTAWFRDRWGMPPL